MGLHDHKCHESREAASDESKYKEDFANKEDADGEEGGGIKSVKEKDEEEDANHEVDTD